MGRQRKSQDWGSFWQELGVGGGAELGGLIKFTWPCAGPRAEQEILPQPIDFAWCDRALALGVRRGLDERAR